MDYIRGIKKSSTELGLGRHRRCWDLIYIHLKRIFGFCGILKRGTFYFQLHSRCNTETRFTQVQPFSFDGASTNSLLKERNKYSAS